MSPTSRLILLAFLVGSPALDRPALAQDAGRADIIRGLCRPDGCDEFAIISKQPVEESDHGILFRTRVRTFTSSAQGRTDQGEENGYVFCSALTPAILSEQNGQAIAFLLAPYASRESRENTNFYALYFAMCHGTEAGRMAARDWRGVANSFNYKVSAAQSRTMTLVNPRDIVDVPFR
jgi:hypothetical protein